MAKVIYLNQTEGSNKFWEYEIADNSVVINWGRVGLGGQSQEKSFSSQGALWKFLNSKIAEKERKGYKQIDQKTLKEETETANDLGHQYKISRMMWMDRQGNRLTQIQSYDPTRWVYVEVLNSWSKEVIRLLLSKTESLRIEGGITEIEQRITFGEIFSDGSHFVQAVRNYLKRLFSKVVEVIKTVKFAAIGTRNLTDDDSIEGSDLGAIYDAVESTAADIGVVARFAGMGNRILEL